MPPISRHSSRRHATRGTRRARAERAPHTHKSRPPAPEETRGRRRPPPAPPPRTPRPLPPPPAVPPPPSRPQLSPAWRPRCGLGRRRRRPSSRARGAQQPNEPPRPPRLQQRCWSTREEACRHSDCAREPTDGRVSALRACQPVQQWTGKRPKLWKMSAGRCAQAARGGESGCGTGCYAPL